jgi:mRNA interferase YafQ
MPLKKDPSKKRASFPRASDYARSFESDWERLSKSGRYDMNRLKEAMRLIIDNEGPLGKEWLDHPLTGPWKNHRECHIGGDFLLIYKIVDIGSKEWVIFVRAGTHSELFK